jgi:hypothetical protein
MTHGGPSIPTGLEGGSHCLVFIATWRSICASPPPPTATSGVCRLRDEEPKSKGTVDDDVLGVSDEMGGSLDTLGGTFCECDEEPKGKGTVDDDVFGASDEMGGSLDTLGGTFCESDEEPKGKGTVDDDVFGAFDVFVQHVRNTREDRKYRISREGRGGVTLPARGFIGRSKKKKKKRRRGSNREK